MSYRLTAGPPPPLPSDTVEVSDLVRTLKRQWRAIIGFLALGVIGAVMVVLFAPRRFEGRASVLARPGAAGGASIMSRLTGGLGELMGSVAGVGGGRTELETELQVLKSRELAGQAVDSLQLQFSVRDPEGVAPKALIAASTLSASFAPRTYAFRRAANGNYTTEHDGQRYELTPGQAGRLDIGTVTLAASAPAEFKVKVFDREDAITRVGNSIRITKAGGDVARIVYRGEDSLTAAAVPNALIAFYMERRQTTDRGVNQRRVDYVSAQLDSTARELAEKERALREYQERSGILDAELVGSAELEGSAELRKAYTELEVDAASINQFLAQAAEGRMNYRQLAAYPAFLRGSSVSPMITQLGDLESRKQQLLERRTEQDPEVIALDQSIKGLEAQILGMARSYALAVNRQRAEMATRIDSMQRKLLALPAAAERGGRLQRDITRLTTIFGALQAQLVEARLAAIGEGGELRQLDTAVPPRKAAFPAPVLTLGLGTAGGLFAGIIAALFMGWFGRYVRDPVDVERLTGVNAQRLEADAPLLLAGPQSRTILVVPLEASAPAAMVAQQLVRTAEQRALKATILDLTSGIAIRGNGREAPAAADVGGAIAELESDHELVVVQLSSLSSPATVAAMRETRPVLLVADARVDRARLSGAVDTLRRMDVPCAGVVIGDRRASVRSSALIG